MVILAPLNNDEWLIYSYCMDTPNEYMKIGMWCSSSEHVENEFQSIQI